MRKKGPTKACIEEALINLAILNGHPRLLNKQLVDNRIIQGGDKISPEQLETLKTKYRKIAGEVL